jgi:hypothetical protein
LQADIDRLRLQRRGGRVGRIVTDLNGRADRIAVEDGADLLFGFPEGPEANAFAFVAAALDLVGAAAP